MTVAITREVSSRFNECEVTHIARTPIDVKAARAEHHEYISALKQLGCKVIELPEEPDLPDSVFVEDTAFILDEVAVITRPGADSRKPETESITQALAPYRPLVHITEPATVDGGDVLVLGKNIHIGISTRSNDAAIRQTQELLKSYGYKVTGVEMHDCLHLKTAVTRVDEKTLLLIQNGWTPSISKNSIGSKWTHPNPLQQIAFPLERRLYSRLRSQRLGRSWNKKVSR
jgi:dimethylargininase